MPSGSAMPTRKAARPPERKPSRLTRWMEREDRRSREPGRGIPLVFVGLAIATLALGLAVLSIVSRLDLNRVEDAPPLVGIAQQGDEPAIHIITAEPGLSWSDLELGGTCSLTLNGQPLSQNPAAPVSAGDVLSCQPGQTLEIGSTQGRGGATLYHATFPQ